MLVFVLIFVAIICSGLTVAKKNEFFEDYCSPKNTNTINEDVKRTADELINNIIPLKKAVNE